ncbi:hypothetical protein ACFLXP_05845 [Chloroflexota bacterium]
MTHTLHRKGSKDSLTRDYVFLCMAAKGINEDGADDKMRKFLRIVMRHNAVNAGDMRTGNIITTGIDEIIDKVTSTSIVHGVFVDLATVSAVMKDLKEADLGLSVVVSGLFQSVEEAYRKAGIIPHSRNYSAGIWGKTEKLPKPEILEITTMCGHAMISPYLVEDIIKRIRFGRITTKEGSIEIGKGCCCGIYNPNRAEELLEKLVQ